MTITTTPKKSTGLTVLLPTGQTPHAGRVLDSPKPDRLAIFTVCLTNNRTETVTGATAYQPEGPLTTFFASNSSRGVIDSWATRVASFRTADLVSVRREVISANEIDAGDLVIQAA